MFLRNLTALWVSQILTKALMFFTLAVLARRIAPEDYGAIEYALGLSALVAVIIEGGMGSVGIRRLSMGVATARDLAAIILTGQLVLALLVLPIAAVLAWLFTEERQVIILSIGVLMATLLLPFRQDWLFQALGRMSHIGGAQLVRVLVFSTIVLAFVDSGEGLMYVVGAEIISVAVSAAWLLIVQFRTITPVGLCFSRSQITAVFRDGGAIALGAVLWAAIQFLPLFVFAGKAGMAETAYYGAAHRVAVSLVTFSWLYHFNLFPMVARRVNTDAAAVDRLNAASVRVTSWAGVGLALGLTLCAEPLLELLFGEPFRKASAALSVLVWTFPITVISGHARWSLIAAGHARDGMHAQLAGLGVAALSSWLLIGPFGAVGAASALIAACLAAWGVTQILAVRRGLRVPAMTPLIPAFTAAAVLYLARLVRWDAWIECTLGVLLFGILALCADRVVLKDLRWLLRVDAPVQPESAVGTGSPR
jgi:O-antigen/teichoic acid export membrane protein